MADDAEPSATLLRPFGYVEPRPVVESLGVRGLSIGNRHAATHCVDREFDAVLSVSAQSHPLTTHHHPLVDGEGNDWAAFAAAVDAARELSRLDGPVLVTCKAGVSRSTAVLATAIASEAGQSFREGLRAVEAARPAALPHPALVELGVCYLAAEE